MRRRGVQAGVLLAVAIVAAPAAIASEQAIGPGTTLTTVRNPVGHRGAEAFVIRVDLRDPGVRTDLVYPGRIAGVQRLSAMAAHAGAFAAVNGDFFNIGRSGAPVGPVVSGGHLLKGPERHRQLVAGVGTDGVGRVAHVWLHGKVRLPGHRTRALTVLNDAAVGDRPMLGPDGIALFTSQWGTYPRTGAVRGLRGITEVLVRGGTVRRVRHSPGRGPIPADGFVLIGAGSGGQALGRLRRGQHVSVKYRQGTDAPRRFRFAVGGKYLLVFDGRVQPGIPGGIGRPRTAIGFGRHGHEMILSVVSGGARGTGGLSLPEEAFFLRGLGVRNAIAFDDGGSTTMVAPRSTDGPPRLLNKPSDGRERKITNGVGVFAAAPPPPSGSRAAP